MKQSADNASNMVCAALMFIYWKDFAEASLSFTEPHKRNDNQNKNSQGKQTHSWMDLLVIIELHRWEFPGVTKCTILYTWFETGTT